MYVPGRHMYVPGRHMYVPDGHTRRATRYHGETGRQLAHETEEHMDHVKRMLEGLPYLPADETLTAQREACARKLFAFNHLPPERWGERPALLRGILGHVGANPEVNAPLLCDYGYNIHVGDDFYANYNLVVLDAAPVRIGDHCFIAPNVAIYTAGHPLHADPRNRGYEYALPVTIGHNVWIGGNSVILPGVSIGDNAVIGAGSIVNRDVPANTLAVGNPCRPIRHITEDDRCLYRTGHAFDFPFSAATP